MKKVLFILIVIMLGVGLSQGVYAYTIGASWSWNSGDPNYNSSAVINPGTIDTSNLVFGNFLGRSATNLNAWYYGDSGVSVGWNDTWVSLVGNANTNGDSLDGLWVQIYSDGGWWDLGNQFKKVAVFTSQDHGPYLGEGLEYRVFGTNTLWTGTLSTQAPITDVYLDGWRPHNPLEDGDGNGWLSDDISGVFEFDSYYRYIKLIAWAPYVSGYSDYSEPEIDAVAGVPPAIPEPSTLLLLGSGLAGLAALRRKFKI